MTQPTEPLSPDLLAREYAAALRAYVSDASEAALTRAYDLGREAASGGLGILDLALAHHQALGELPPQGAGGRSPVAMAAQFLAEALSPFEMTLRSYRANARLLGLGETLAQQNAEIDRSRQQLRSILDATTAVIYLKDASDRYLFVNRRFQEVFGVGRDEVVGRRGDEVLAPAVAGLLQADDGQVLAARAPRELEEVVPGPDGPRTYLSLKFPLLDDAGVPYGVSCVATDVTERKRAEEAVRREREAAERERQLKEAVEARDRFLSITSHELRTPLTSLELQVGALRRVARSRPGGALPTEAFLGRCEVIARQVERLTVLVQNLIDVGKITSGHLTLSPEPCDLGELVADVLGRMQDEVQRSGSEVAVRAPGPVVGRWDRRLLEAVVAHLLSNAVKFGEGKPVEIAVDRTGAAATLTVRDHGIGISAQDQQRVFERFERAVSERHFGGFGVGLWVARKVVEAHGGAIRVRSEGGAGSEFTVELPLA